MYLFPSSPNNHNSNQSNNKSKQQATCVTLAQPKQRYNKYILLVALIVLSIAFFVTKFKDLNFVVVYKNQPVMTRTGNLHKDLVKDYGIKPADQLLIGKLANLFLTISSLFMYFSFLTLLSLLSNHTLLAPFLFIFI